MRGVDETKSYEIDFMRVVYAFGAAKVFILYILLQYSEFIWSMYICYVKNIFSVYELLKFILVFKLKHVCNALLNARIHSIKTFF